MKMHFLEILILYEPISALSPIPLTLASAALCAHCPKADQESGLPPDSTILAYPRIDQASSAAHADQTHMSARK